MTPFFFFLFIYRGRRAKKFEGRRVKNMKRKNKCKYWGENIYPWFDDGCHIGYSFCDPSRCKDYSE